MGTAKIRGGLWGKSPDLSVMRYNKVLLSLCQVREYQATVRQDIDRSKFKDIEKELNLAKNLTKSLSNEVDDLKDALMRAEAENESLRQQQGTTTRSVTPTSQVTM